MISLIYPINSNSADARLENRLKLFQTTIESIKAYALDITDKFEILVLDEKSTDNVKDYVLSLKNIFDISYIKYKSPYPIFTGSFVNNMGVNLSKYNSFIFSSPEVKHVSPAIKQFLARVGENIIGKVDAADKNGKIFRTYMSSTCPNRSNDPGFYFLAMYNKSDFWEVGGLDEDYMQGIGYEDKDFGWRFKVHHKFSVIDEIYGIHQWHGESSPKCAELFRNGALLNEKKSQGIIKCNTSRVAGDIKYVIERV